MANTTNNLLFGANAFARCAPNISTDIRHCGTVTTCSAKAMTQADLLKYTKSGDYLIMGSLLKHDMEIKMCETVQNGLYDFLMANKVNINKKMAYDQITSGLYRIKPYIMAKRFSPINNAYWIVSGGLTSGANWQVDVRSSSNIPPDIRSFNVDERVYIEGLTGGGTKTMTAWIIVSSTLINNAVRLVLSAQNSGSFLASGRLASPVTGLLVRGTANKDDFEKFCAEPPSYLNWNLNPFWVETQRTTMCRSTMYDKYRAWLMKDNELYREYGDLDEIERNRQAGADFQKRMVETMFWGKAINSNQTIALFDQLPSISSFNGGTLGVDGAKCVGLRANMIGIYEQLVQCNRVVDLQGAQLNLISLFLELYNIKRVRESSGRGQVTQIDVFTDNITAEAINQAMIAYYNAKSGGMLRLTVPVNESAGVNFNKDQEIHKANFGFNYRSYNLFYPAIRLNVVTHYFFDDKLDASNLAGQANAGRFLLVLDFAGIYPGIMRTNHKVLTTGQLKDLAAISSDYACVLETNEQTQELTSVTGTVIVECPAGNLWLENFSSAVPAVTTGGAPYPPTTTTTTTTSS